MNIPEGWKHLARITSCSGGNFIMPTSLYLLCSYIFNVSDNIVAACDARGQAVVTSRTINT
jgi:hypothetical protein